MCIYVPPIPSAFELAASVCCLRRPHLYIDGKREIMVRAPSEAVVGLAQAVVAQDHNQICSRCAEEVASDISEEGERVVRKREGGGRGRSTGEKTRGRG